jgi:hypothetical protein
MKTPSNLARSIRYAALMTMIAAASAVQACSSDSPVEPSVADQSTSQPTTQPPTQPAAFRIFGIVTDDDGIPVSGVKVTLYRYVNGLTTSSTVTDTMGFYSISFGSGAGMSLLTEKAGYESKWHSRGNPSGDVQFDLRIHRLN